MYTNTRVNEWTYRSKSLEYQNAYDTIVEHIPNISGGRYFEAACGTGEILKRIYKRGSSKSIFGSDYSRQILEFAQQDLLQAGIDVLINDNVSDHLFNSDLSQLVLDDLLESKIPSYFSDVTIFAFPELGIKYNKLKSDRKLIMKFSKRFGEFDHSFYDDMLVTLRSIHHLSRITKRKGKLVLVEYDISRGKDSVYDRSIVNTHRDMWDMFGVKLDEHFFFENPKVWSDTLAALDHSLDLSNVLKGYRLFSLTKR